MKLQTVVLACASLICVTAHATNCNSDCEGHFDKWYQGPDLARCKAERIIACKWGVEHCDFHSHTMELNTMASIIQESHSKNNSPETVHQCYEYIDKGALAHSIGEKGYQLYQLAEGVSSKFNPYAILGKEYVKQVLRCACKKAQWRRDSDRLNTDRQQPSINGDHSFNSEFGTADDASSNLDQF